MYHVDHDLAVRSCRNPQGHSSPFIVFPHFSKRDDATAYATRELRKREKARSTDLRENDQRLITVRQELASNPLQLSGEAANEILGQLAHWYSKRELLAAVTDADKQLYAQLTAEILCSFRTYLQNRYRTSRFSQAQLDLLYKQADHGRGVLKLEKRYREYAAFAKAFATAR